MSEAERQKWYYDRKANLVLAKADSYKGKRKVKTGGRRNPMKWNAKVTDGVPSYDRMLTSPPLELTFITPVRGTPLCTVV